MLEWLVTIGAAELGKAVFEQVLKLGQAAAEDYVKDFFKGCVKEGMTAAKPEVAKKAVAAALKAFLLVVADELEDQELSQAKIRDRYDPALIQFVKDDAVKPLLGQAFEKDCVAIDVAALAGIWARSHWRDQPFPTLPAEFDWSQIGSKYLKKVRRIVRETPELRSLLETELLEDIARNTAQISPGFDVAKYRESLQCSYGHLKLYAIDSTDRGEPIKLWNMFIEQTVREALPPTRYELPLDLKQQLQAAGQLETDLSAEALDQYRSEYFQQPARKVLAVVGKAQAAQMVNQICDFSEKSQISQRTVILGDPGAGKSTLLQYLALSWVETKKSEFLENSDFSARLPLLIELREYAMAQTHGFLEFLHCGRGVDWQFDQQQLHHHLQSHPTLVMFDGLDEVFDRTTQSAIIDDIIRFSQQYPQTQILITSRVIGYNPERLQHANFRHFTIQPLDTDEIHEFIDRWYTLALGNDPDKLRLVTRLKDAIANSKAIQNLADNPLLLTMMAILNRRQELPRDRADLYDQASRVLLYHWDVDHKRLQLPMDAIGRREKQEMLRAIAYEMQTSEEGLKGNLISADRLTRILTDYLREQGFGEPREKANGLIEQLRHRNWILCDRGANTYGFVHRTFLEYFCAMEIVHRFEKSRTLTFEQLRDEVFGRHWQDETWHEVLRLICGAIAPQFAGELIEFLMTRECDRDKFTAHQLGDNETHKRALKPGGLLNLLLVSDCLKEIKFFSEISLVSHKLCRQLQQEFEQSEIPFTWQTSIEVVDRIFQHSPPNEFLSWLKMCVQSEIQAGVGVYAQRAMVRYFRSDLDTMAWLNAQTLTQAFLRTVDPFQKQ
jgi:GTPase SAR1 family protein